MVENESMDGQTGRWRKEREERRGGCVRRKRGKMDGYIMKRQKGHTWANTIPYGELT